MLRRRLCSMRGMLGRRRQDEGVTPPADRPPTSSARMRAAPRDSALRQTAPQCRQFHSAPQPHRPSRRLQDSRLRSPGRPNGATQWRTSWAWPCAVSESNCILVVLRASFSRNSSPNATTDGHDASKFTSIVRQRKRTSPTMRYSLHDPTSVPRNAHERLRGTNADGIFNLRRAGCNGGAMCSRRGFQ